ncbi:hypothetical protein [Sphingomonas zeae]
MIFLRLSDEHQQFIEVQASPMHRSVHQIDEQTRKSLGRQQRQFAQLLSTAYQLKRNIHHSAPVHYQDTDSR